jgi:cytochrome c553
MQHKKFLTAIPFLFICAVTFNSANAGEYGRGNVAAGKAKSVLCLGCHGVHGEGKMPADQQPAYPRIAGQISDYFIKSIYDYKKDIRNDPLMNALSKSLTDADIANLAAFYASLD